MQYNQQFYAADQGSKEAIPLQQIQFDASNNVPRQVAQKQASSHNSAFGSSKGFAAKPPKKSGLIPPGLKGSSNAAYIKRQAQPGAPQGFESGLKISSKQSNSVSGRPVYLSNAGQGFGVNYSSSRKQTPQGNLDQNMPPSHSFFGSSSKPPVFQNRQISGRQRVPSGKQLPGAGGLRSGSMTMPGGKGMSIENRIKSNLLSGSSNNLNSMNGINLGAQNKNISYSGFTKHNQKVSQNKKMNGRPESGRNKFGQQNSQKNLNQDNADILPSITGQNYGHPKQSVNQPELDINTIKNYQNKMKKQQRQHSQGPPQYGAHQQFQVSGDRMHKQHMNFEAGQEPPPFNYDKPARNLGSNQNGPRFGGIYSTDPNSNPHQKEGAKAFRKDLFAKLRQMGGQNQQQQ